MLEILPPELRRILVETPELNRAYLVGGCVRDWVRGQPSKDFDVEVFGLGLPKLAEVLARWGKTGLVGKSFGVVKLAVPSGLVLDFSLPRRDSKNGPGHTGFAVEFDASISPAEAASRRDFTINALMFDPRKRELLDFFGGAADLKNGVLRHVSAAFPEDPLRVLRGMQLAARFELAAAPETISLARSISETFTELAKERVREEWFKWAGRGVRPSLGLSFLEQSGWIRHFPEVAALRGTEQDPVYHPEGDVFTHTALCCDEMAKLERFRGGDEDTRVVLMLATLTHDFGKPPTTRRIEKEGRQRIVSRGHDIEGVPLAEKFLHRIDAPTWAIERVLPLVRWHMAALEEPSARFVRRIARNLRPESWERLVTLMEADTRGRAPRKPALERVRRLEQMARDLELNTGPPKRLLLGRHLLERGFTPGPGMGVILENAYQAQIEGAFHDLEGALKWLDRHEAS